MWSNIDIISGGFYFTGFLSSASWIILDRDMCISISRKVYDGNSLFVLVLESLDVVTRLPVSGNL